MEYLSTKIIQLWNNITRWITMSIGNRLKEIRNINNLSQIDFADKLNTTQGNLSKMEANKIDLSTKIIETIMQNWNINPSWLITGNGDMLIKDTNNHTHLTEDEFDIPTYLRRQVTDDEQSSQIIIESDTIILPHYTNVSAAAGSGELVYDETSVKQVRISSSIINIQHSNNICIINATGHSMQPMINDGDLLIVDLNHKDYLDEGIYVVRLDNSLLVKHLQKIPNGMCLISENPKFQPIILTTDNFNENSASIIGKVLSVIKNFTSSMM